MKNGLVVSALVMLTITVTLADSDKQVTSKDQRIMQRAGGLLPVKGTPSGSIVIVNSQKKFGAENFDISKQGSSIGKLASVTRIVSDNYNEKESLFDQLPVLKAKYKADFFLIIVDVAKLPPSLVAAELQWAILNIGALRNNAATEDVVRIRARNEFARVYAMLCGGFASQFNAPLTNQINDISDLDSCLYELPIDMEQRILTYLHARGVVPVKLVTYRYACQQGWAPAPTNQYQQAIWDKVHAVPKNPMKIEFDPKKGR